MQRMSIWHHKRLSAHVLLHIILGTLPRDPCVSAKGVTGGLPSMLASKQNAAKASPAIVA